MNVVEVTWEYPPVKSGGLAEHCRGLSEELASQSVQPHVLTSGQEARRKRNGVDIHRLEIGSAPDDVSWAMQFGRRVQEKGIELDSENGVDVVHAHDWMAVPGAAGLAEALDVPLVFTLHSMQRLRSGLGSDYESAIHNIEWYGTYKADEVICVGKEFRDRAGREFEIPGEKLRYIPNGVDPDRFGDVPELERSRFAREEERIVLYAGRMLPEKGPQHLVKAFDKVVDKHGDAKLVMCGGGHEQRYREMADSVLGDKVCVPGFVDESVLKGLMAESYTNVTPSLSEPFGLVPLEAAASGTATVGSRVGGIKETVVHGYTGLHSKPGSPESIEHELDRMLSDPGWTNWMSKKAEKRVEKAYNWSSVSSQTAEVYRSVA